MAQDEEILTTEINTPTEDEWDNHIGDNICF
jgi:hypothetical protein